MTSLTALQSNGYSVLPIHSVRNGVCTCGNPNCNSPGKHPRTRNGVKDASNDPAVVADWEKQYPDTNVAIATGDALGFFALDIDLKSGGPENLAKLEAEYGPLTETVEEFTGGGGRHLLYRSDGRPVKNRTHKGAIRPGVEVKGDGGYIVVAPSIHASGRRYEWVEGRAPWEIEIAEAPEWLIDLMFQEPAKVQKSIQDQTTSDEGLIAEGGRNVAVTRLAGQLRRIGMDEDKMRETLAAFNLSNCNPPLGQAEVDRIVDSICQHNPVFPITDVGNAERLIFLYGHQIRYVTDSKRWLYYDGVRWSAEISNLIQEHAKATVRQIKEEAVVMPEANRKEYLAWAKKSESRERISAMIELAKSDPRVASREADFDKDPWLLNLRNGVLDLRTGELYPHDPELLMTKLAPVDYDKNARCPIWEAAMQTWTGGDPQLTSYLQRAFGYMMTGETREQCIFIAFGTGANGKSVSINTVMRVLGDYAIQTPVETIMVKNGTGIPNDIARLKGKRMVAATEGESGQKLAESLVKQMSGGDLLVGRFLYGEFFQFKPQLKLVLVTNHKPVIHGQDDGIWRRIQLIPFEVTIPEGQRDKELVQKLETELPGILNWMIRGCQEWLQKGLESPQSMQRAKAVYKSEMDPIGNFIEEECSVKNGCKITGDKLFAAYQYWADESGEKGITRRLFYRKLREKGFDDRKSAANGSTEFYGLELKREAMGFEWPPASQKWGR